ncbi:MAG: D-alanine--D-alanine ligase [Clostridia bacterium]|nr:D-alanine--D-alanine ligase [Clostridia bacterium]
MKHVLILFGGVSSEHEVSLRSAAAVIDHVDRDRWSVSTVGITKDGKWYLYTGETVKIADGSWIRDTANLTTAALSPDRSVHGLTVFDANGTRQMRVDVVFPVLHGKNGEDGAMQGFLQLAGIPFVGCDMLSSAMCMDKAVTNTIADHIGVPQAKWLGVTRTEYAQDAEGLRKKAAAYLGFPLFVKPANAGSSVGVTKVCAPDALDSAVAAAFAEDAKIVLEEGIDGIELECAVIGNESPEAPMVGEITPCNDFYDYEAKYVAADSALHIPARVDEETFRTVQQDACRIYRALGCSGLSRVDFFRRKSDGKVLFNEINTIPGFTSISMYAKMLVAAGWTFGGIVERLLTLALEKWG